MYYYIICYIFTKLLLFSLYLFKWKALYICWDWTLPALSTPAVVTGDIVQHFGVSVWIAGNIAVYPCTGVNVAQSPVVSELVRERCHDGLNLEHHIQLHQFWHRTIAALIPESTLHLQWLVKVLVMQLKWMPIIIILILYQSQMQCLLTLL